jgi:(2Fe-2S) ferredoxin
MHSARFYSFETCRGWGQIPSHRGSDTLRNRTAIDHKHRGHRLVAAGLSDTLRNADTEIRSILIDLDAQEPLENYSRLDDIERAAAAAPLSSMTGSGEWSQRWSTAPPKTSTIHPIAPMRHMGDVLTGEVQVCNGKHCRKRGRDQVERAFIAASHTAPVAIGACKCLGHCKKGVAVKVNVDGLRQVVYSGVSTGCATSIVENEFGIQANMHDF